MPRKKNSKKGENKMENENIEIVNAEVTPEVEPSVEPEVTPEVEPSVEPEVEPSVENSGAVSTGVVAGCAKLNLRKEANKTSAVVGVLDKGVTVQVDLDNSTDEFYKVNAYGKEGYCMKQFISIK